MFMVQKSEINSPVEVGSLSMFIPLLLSGEFYTSQVVVWDFFHQLYQAITCNLTMGSLMMVILALLTLKQSKIGSDIFPAGRLMYYRESFKSVSGQ